MKLKQKNILKRLLVSSITLILISLSIMPAYGQILFESEFLLQNSGNVWIIDASDDAGGDINLQFGSALGKTLGFDSTNDWFKLNDDLSLDQNQLRNVVLDNKTDAPLTPVAGQIYHNTTDGNTYIYNGSMWEDVTDISDAETKVITVGTGLDYATVASAATYLNSLSGGIMLLSAETHAVATAVNLTNITLTGKGAGQTTIQISGNGQIDALDTHFAYLFLDVDAINDDMGIDIQSGSSSLQFEWVDIDIQDSSDSLIDSNEIIAPTTTINFINCYQNGGTGTGLKSKSTGNLNASSKIFVSGASGNSLLKLDDWDVTIQGEGNVYTTGTITTIPDSTIFVYPGMNLQGAVNSLSTGGSITLLPGTHAISQPLIISNDSIEIIGYSEASVIAASGFTGGNDTTAAIQIGAANGSAPVNGVILRDFKLTVDHDTGESDIHGIRAAGGSDNQVINVTIEKVLGQSGTGGLARIGIQFLDGTLEKLIRPVIQNSRILGDSINNYYFTDGVHISSDGDISGVWGYDQGVDNALMEGNFVDYVGETGYVLVGVENSSLFNNRSTRMGASGLQAYGIFISNAKNMNMNANVFTGSLSTSAIAIGVDPFNTGILKETIDCIFNNNVIDGTASSGVGFATGFQIGASGNTGVHRNSFQNNTIRGASNITTTAVDISGNADNNSFSNNDIAGNGNSWDTGIDLKSSTQEQNLVRGNSYTSVTTILSDSGTGTKISVEHHRSTSDPTVNDDTGDGYRIGTVWINTSLNKSFVLVDDTVAAADWNQIDSVSGNPTGTTSNTFTLDTDDTGGDVTFQFGTTLAETLKWDSANTRFVFTDDLRAEGNLAVVGSAYIAGDHLAIDSNGVINLGLNSSSWESLTWNDANDQFELSDDLNLSQSQIKSAAIDNLASAPGLPVSGQIYYNTANNNTYIYNGSTWEDITAVGGGGAVVDYGTTAGLSGGSITTNFNQTFTIAPKVTITPTSSNAFSNNKTWPYISATTTTNFTITAATTYNGDTFNWVAAGQ